MRTAWCIAFAIVCTVVLVGCTSTTPTSSDNTLQSRLVAEVSGAGAVTHLEMLQRIADNNGGNRASPGPGYDASVDYVAAILRDAGYEVSTPTFRMANTTVRNVIAQTRTGSPERVVMAGAHLDSVPEGPGINDNGSGVSALLEIAVRLGGSPEVSNAVRFAWWGAGEVDLNGSTHYVETLSADERDRIALYLNVDMAASPNPGYLVRGGEGDGSHDDAAGSAAVARVLVDQLAAAGVTAETVELDGGSDYAPFIEAGIPSVGVESGDQQRKTAKQAERWGGRAGEVFDSCYHRACDRLDNINATASTATPTRSPAPSPTSRCRPIASPDEKQRVFSGRVRSTVGLGGRRLSCCVLSMFCGFPCGRVRPVPVHRQVVASAEPFEVSGDEILDPLQALLVGGFGAQRQRVRGGLHGALTPAQADSPVGVGPFGEFFVQLIIVDPHGRAEQRRTERTGLIVELVREQPPQLAVVRPQRPR